MYILPTNFKKLKHVCKGCQRTEEFCTCEPKKEAIYGNFKICSFCAKVYPYSFTACPYEHKILEKFNETI